MSYAVIKFGALARKAGRAARRAPSAAVSEKPAAMKVAEADKVPEVPFDNSCVLGLHSVGRFHEVSHVNSCEIYRSTELNLQVMRPHKLNLYRFYSTSNLQVLSNEVSGSHQMLATRKHSRQIMELINSGPDDLELKLDAMNVRPSLSSILRIFRTINSKKVSALRFFRWTEKSWPDLGRNPNICSLVIDNCGRLEDYETMFLLLKEFSLNGLCLTEKAFTFLTVSRSSVMDAVNKTIEVLNQVGGPCRNSGVFALIETFSRFGSFEMAKYVIQITEVKASYYNIMAREKCRRCDFEDVKVMIDEMRQAGFGPAIGIFNYFISSLCRSGKLSEALHMIEEIEGTDCPPNALTFEILINHYIREGKMNVATQLLDRMALIGIEPRITTHTAFVKGYFHREQPEEAYKYAVSSVNNSSNETYSLLARLHLEKGDTITAQKILLEMIEKGLKPSLSVHWGVLKTFKKTGEICLAQELASSFARFKTQLNSEAG
ncbi:uncharacterized protein J3R85_007797 [Psidium guajava]|nr:uncharacterized protein J3R85_007797 [Psidium guajava]